MKAAFATIDGKRVRYLHAGTGPLLVCIQPIGHSGDVFLRNIDVLAAHCTVIAPDLPGHGFSDALDFAGTSPQRASARQLALLCEQLGFTRYSVLGSSYGGLVAAMMWVEHPRRVDALIFVGSGSVFQPASVQEKVLRAVFANAHVAMADPSLQSCRARLGNICYAPESVADEVPFVQMTCYALPDRLQAYQATLEGVIAHLHDPDHNTCDRLGQIDKPTLVLTGRQDIRAKWEILKEGAARMPRAEFELLEECGHLPYMEQPDIFNARVADFLTRVTRLKS
jgi:2-hydroxy-6-oxonona-2,4-dienedioate hydrolase